MSPDRLGRRALPERERLPGLGSRIWSSASLPSNPHARIAEAVFRGVGGDVGATVCSRDETLVDGVTLDREQGQAQRGRLVTPQSRREARPAVSGDSASLRTLRRV